MHKHLVTLDVSCAQERAQRTLGIFGYPKGSHMHEVAQHAAAFGNRFGRVVQALPRYGSKQRPFVILNFDTATEVQAALSHPELYFEGLPVEVSAWRPPGQDQEAGEQLPGRPCSKGCMLKE